jgi:hypothetical protein
VAPQHWTTRSNSFVFVGAWPRLGTFVLFRVLFFQYAPDSAHDDKLTSARDHDDKAASPPKRARILIPKTRSDYLALLTAAPTGENSCEGGGDAHVLMGLPPAG